MSTLHAPLQLPARRITPDWTALPSWIPVPDMGVLPVNAFLMKGAEPLLVDTGLAALSEPMLASLCAEIDLADLRWIWLSHTDADHIGNLDRILAAAPGARVLTTFLGAGKLSMLGVGDPARVRLLQPGDVVEVNGHRLYPVRPPYYDAPETMGFMDATGRVLFTADAFGALLPEVVDTLDEVPDAALREGMLGWSAIDAPWLADQRPDALAATLRKLEAMAPEHVLSGHLPAARGVATLTGVLDAAYGAACANAPAGGGRADPMAAIAAMA